MITMKRCVSLLLTVVILLGMMPTTVQASLTETVSGTCGENMTWELTPDGTMTIAGTGEMEGHMSNADFPWYAYRKKIIKIVIEDGITAVLAGAFAYCSNLEKVIIPASTTYVGVFTYCPLLKTAGPIGSGCNIEFAWTDTLYSATSDALTEITIPSTISIIGESALRGCNKLTSINLPDSLVTIEDLAFAECSSLSSIVIPESVTSIGSHAFWDCSSLNNLSIPEGITSISRGCFEGCSSFTTFFIPSSVSLIESFAFAHCVNLTSINLPTNITEISPYTFNDCRSLTDIVIPESVNSIEYNAFSGCSSLNRIVIPESVTDIGEDAFSGCSSLNYIGIPSSLKNYESGFSGCTGLTEIAIPDGVTKVDKYAFSGCDNLETVILPESVTKIDDYAFSRCESLTSITIPDSVTSIGDRAFNYCYSLTSISVDNANANYKSIDGVLFDKAGTSLLMYPLGKDGIYVIPEGVTSIGDYGFYNCDSITDITISDSVTSIGDYGFYDCDNLTDITISDSVTNIGLLAFHSCDSLTDVYYAGTKDQWNEISIHPGNKWLTDATIHFNSSGYDTNSVPNNGTYTSPQESTWYDIWCADISKFDRVKGFDLTVGDDVINTGDTHKARATIPYDMAGQVSVSKDGYITASIPEDLVYTCHEVVLYPDDHNAPFAQFVTARKTGTSTYVNLSASRLSAYENSMTTYDFFVDINWNGSTPGMIYLKQGDTAIELKEGKNTGVLLGMFSRDGGDVELYWHSGEGNIYHQKLYLDIYKNSVSNISIDGGATSTGTNSARPEVDEMWGGMKLSFDLFNDSVPVELELKPTSVTKGTFEGTLGIKLENADEKATVIDYLDTVLNKDISYISYESLKKALPIKSPDAWIAKQANSFAIGVETQLLGFIEGTYELGSDGNLINMEFTDSKILGSLEGKVSTTRQHLVTPVPWYWTLQIKAGVEMALCLNNEYDGSKASIAPTELNTSLSLAPKAAVGVSGAASVGISGNGTMHLDGQLLPFDLEKTEIYADYAINVFDYEVGPWSGSAFTYKSDSYYILKDCVWFPDQESIARARTNLIANISDSMTMSSRDYLYGDSEFISAQPAILFALDEASDNSTDIKTNTYTFTNPQIVELENGNWLMVWVDDPGTEIRPADINRAALFYSVYDGNAWCEPEMVADDATADSDPVLKTIDGDTYLVWVNENAELTEDDSYEQYCAAMEIAYAKFDISSNAFVDVENISNNEFADSIPDLTVLNGSPTVFWIQNSANDVLQHNGTNSLYMAQLTDGIWETTLLQDNLKAVDKLSADNSNNELKVFYSLDTDGDIATTYDREIIQHNITETTQLTYNNINDLKPVISDGVLYWYCDGNLTDGNNTIIMAENTDRYSIVSNGNQRALLYKQVDEEFSTTIYAHYYSDGKWSEPVALFTSSDYIVSFSGLMAADGSVTVISNDATMSDGVMEEATLRMRTASPKCDILIDSVSYNPLSLAPYGNLEINAEIRNIGTETVDEVTVYLYHDGSLIREETQEIVLTAGSASIIPITCKTQDAYSFTAEDLTVTILPSMSDDWNEEDNSADLHLNRSDVSVENLSAQHDGNIAIISAYISNRGLDDLENIEVSLRLGSVDGEVIDTININSIYVAEGEAVCFETDIAEDSVVYVTAEVAVEENSTSNNDAFTIVQVAEDLLEGEEAQHNHNYTEHITKPTCNDQGYTTYKCNCGHEYVDNYVDSTGHAWDGGKVTKNPEIGVEGIKTFTCENCGETRTETIPALPDEPVDEPCKHTSSKVVNRKDATCTATGYTGDKVCSICGEIVEKGTTISMKAHTEVIDKAVSATCTTSGKTEGKHCSVCQTVLVKQETVPATGHNWGDWEVTKPATGAEMGEEKRSCTICGLEETRSIDKLSNPFVDVQAGKFYETPVLWAVENGVTSGMDATHFAPNDKCTRAQVVTFLWRAAGSPKPISTNNPFTDVKEGKYYYNAVLWALENGITSGTSATTFSPDVSCTRGQVATFLWRTLGKPAASSTNPFTDVAQGKFYYDAVLWAAESGVTSGMTKTTFAPDATCTRGQIVTFLYRALG